MRRHSGHRLRDVQRVRGRSVRSGGLLGRPRHSVCGLQPVRLGRVCVRGVLAHAGHRVQQVPDMPLGDVPDKGMRARSRHGMHGVQPLRRRNIRRVTLRRHEQHRVYRLPIQLQWRVQPGVCHDIPERGVQRYTRQGVLGLLKLWRTRGGIPVRSVHLGARQRVPEVHQLQRARALLRTGVRLRVRRAMRGVCDVPERDVHSCGVRDDDTDGVQGVQRRLPRGDVPGSGVHGDERPRVCPMYDDQERLLHNEGMPGAGGQRVYVVHGVPRGEVRVTGMQFNERHSVLGVQAVQPQNIHGVQREGMGDGRRAGVSGASMQCNPRHIVPDMQLPGPRRHVHHGPVYPGARPAIQTVLADGVPTESSDHGGVLTLRLERLRVRLV